MIKNVLAILSIGLLLGACNMDNPEMIGKQIERKKAQVKKLNEQISELEGKIQVDTTGEDEFKIPVAVKLMKPDSFLHFIEVTGKLEAEEDAFISPEMNGQVETIHVREGQEVKNGKLLLSLNTNLIEASIREVETGLALAEKLYKKQKELWEQKIGSEMQYLEARNAWEQAQARLETLKTQMEMASIRAPFDGVVESIMVKEGEMAMPGMQVLQLVSLEELKLYGDISERYMTSVHKGDDVLVSFPDIEGLDVSAPIYRTGNVIENATRTFRVEIKIDNREKTLKPNMYSLIRINDFISFEAMVVPSMAIKQDIRGSYLYVAEGNSLKARKRYVETGLSYNDQTMILDGISEGDRVIIKGFAQVSDGVDVELR